MVLMDQLDATDVKPTCVLICSLLMEVDDFNVLSVVGLLKVSCQDDNVTGLILETSKHGPSQ